jgi:hypothetical protein
MIHAQKYAIEASIVYATTVLEYLPLKTTEKHEKSEGYYVSLTYFYIALFLFFF